MDIQPSNVEKSIYSTAFDSLYYYGLNEKLESFYAPKAPTAQAGVLDWFRDTSFTVIDSMYFLNHLGYLRSNRGYIDTRFNPSDGVNLSLNSAFYGVKVINKYNYFTTGIQFGVFANGSAIQSQIGLNDLWANNAIHGANTASWSVPDFNGIFSIGRNRSDTAIFYMDDNKFARIRTSNTVPNKNVFLNTLNNDGAPKYYTKNIIEANYASSGLSDFEVIKLHEIITTYSNSMDAIRTEMIWENEGLYAKLVNNDNVGYGLRLVYQKDSKKIAVFADSVFLSLDNGLTYPYKNYNLDAENITFGVMYSNNAILLASSSKKLYVSYDSLQTITERTLKDTSGNDYVYHTPVNLLFPGEYFKVIDIPKTFIDNGIEMFLIGNYGNIQQANPTNIYYSADTLKTIKIAYTFGIDSSYRDNGGTPSSVAGNYLGDTNNPIVCRHVHSVVFSDIDTSYYAATGDSWPNNTGQLESRWIKGKYNKELDEWVWVDFRDYGDALYWKSTALEVINDTIYFGSDGDKGIYKARANQLLNADSIINIYPESPGLVSSMSISQSGEIIAMTSDEFKMAHSLDYGNTFNLVTLKGLIPTDYLTFNTLSTLKQKDSDGWFHLYDNNYPAGPTPGISVLFKIK